MAKVKPIEEPHIVESAYDEKGRTLYEIADNSCVKTKEEADAILRRCGKLYGDSLRRRAEREALEAAQTTA